MTWKKKIKPSSPLVEKRFSNWLAQIAGLLQTKNAYLVLGRGASKTTEFQVERLIEMVYDMPGAPIAWVADTYSNLQKNILPMLVEGLERKGFIQDVHFVIEKQPPEYKNADLDTVPKYIREHFWRPFNHLASYKHTMIFFSGLNITFGSLDRPSSLAGRSYVHVFGDEVKFFPEQKFAKLTKAVRGYRMKYGNSVYYRGHTLTTDMPNINNIGEYDWILKQVNKMNPHYIMLLLKAAFVLNQVKNEYITAKINKEKLPDKLLQRWNKRVYMLRMHPKASTFFYIASSYINVDILTPEYFQDEFETDLEDVKTAILSMKPELSAGNRFYTNLSEIHFYADGNDSYWSEKFGLKDTEDCRILKYLNKEKLLEVGLDFGNMMSMVIAQPGKDNYRILKNIYTLAPEWIRELADKFIEYFKYHKEKVVKLYYDRAGNAYKKAKQDLAGKLKKAIEYDKDDVPTGWKVLLMSEGQANIGQNEEYNFMIELFSNRNKNLPKVLIDKYNCKELKSSLELAATKIKTVNGKSLVVKDKSSEKLPIHRLPLESTNFSDAFKYLMMRRKWRKYVKYNSATYIGDPSIRG